MKIKVLFLAFTVAAALFCSCKPKSATDKAQPDTGMISPKVESIKDKGGWQGVYSGVTPCADCPGIEIEIRLNADGSYEMTRVYKEREEKFTNTGAFTWNEAGTQIDLQDIDEQGAFEHFIVQDGKLLLLTPKGELPEGVDMHLFTLTKK